MPSASNGVSDRLTSDLAAGLYVGAVGSLAVAFLPQMIAAARSSPAFVGSTGELAAFASADTTGMLIGGLLLLYGVRRWNWRLTAAIAAIVLALLNAVTPLLLQGSGVTLVLATRLLTGTCGGLLLGLGLACMHAYARRELGMAIFAIAQMTLGFGGLWSAAQLTVALGPFAIFVVPAVLAVTALVGVAIMPRRPTSDSSASTGTQKVELATWIGLSAALLLHIGFGALWATLARGGAPIGLDMQRMSLTIGLSLVSGGAGSLLVLAGARHVEPRVVMLAGAIGHVAALAALALAPSPLAFTAGLCLFVFSTSIVFPFWVSAITSCQPTALTMVLCMLSYKTGLAVGPALGTIVAEGLGFPAVALFVGTVCVTGYVLVRGLANGIGRRLAGNL